MPRLTQTIIMAICAFVCSPVVGQQPVTPPRTDEPAGRGVIRLRQDEVLFDPSRKKLLSYRDGEVVIKLIYQKNRLAISVDNGTGQGGVKVDLPPEIVQVNEVRTGQKDRAVIVGMVNGSVFEVLILNTRSISFADSFFAYSPAISPDGRFVAFVKFYPAHFVDGTDDHYLLYDLARSAAENRPPTLSLSDHTNVGVPVRPHIPNTPGDNTGVSQPKQHHMMAQAFFWRSDSERYTFADENAGELDVVLVSLSQGAPVVGTVVVSKSELCEELRAETCQLTLSEADLTQTDMIATFRGVGADSSLQQVERYRYRVFSSDH